MITIVYPEGNTIRYSQDGALLPKLLADSQHSFWLDLESPTSEEYALLCEPFHFHPLAIEDASRPRQRPKVDEYEGFVFVVADEIRMGPAETDETASGKSAETENVRGRQIATFLGPNYLVTVHVEPVETVRQFRDRCDHRHWIFDKGPGYLLYMLLDVLVDLYFPLLEAMADRLDDLEDRIVTRPRQDVLETIFTLKRDLTRMRRYAGPLREVTQTLTTRDIPGIQSSMLPYFRDVADHLFRIYETLDNYRDLMSSMLDAYLSQVSNQLNLVMQKLTAVATVFMPITFLTGVFGMNFAHQPWYNTNIWFWMGLMIAIGAATYWWFHRRHIV
ncbi:MAG TPA: magnesium/cobalt transporter CorA [Chthonomonadaceae bacterium]|nr:magnesium/cobalt transporter CorA [Chthonomonadaceae bacterium]